MRLRLAIAGVLYVGGAAGLEMVESVIYAEQRSFTFAYRVISAVEELLEVSGVLIALHALVDHLQRTFQPRLSWEPPRAA